MSEAIAEKDFAKVKELVQDGANVNLHNVETGITPLSTAATYDHVEIARFLLEHNARVSEANRDGNTALHVAAFFCYFEFVELLLENEASVSSKNNNDRTPIDVVSEPWSREISGFYRGIAEVTGLQLDLERIKRDRPKMTKLLREYAKEKGSK